jgi:ABC-type glycerol-3-phosphate transport system permease component
MKTKLEVSPKVQSITTIGLWLIILAVLAFTVINSTPSKAENLNALEVKEIPKNPALKKYHKMQRKMERNVFKPAKRKSK